MRVANALFTGVFTDLVATFGVKLDSLNRGEFGLRTPSEGRLGVAVMLDN